jgi:adenylate cyclase
LDTQEKKSPEQGVAGGGVSFADPAVARRQLRRLAFLIVICSILLRYLPSISPEMEDLYQKARFYSYDLVLRGQAFLTVKGWIQRASVDQVAVVGIDEKALNHFGRWPWNRTLLGELLQAMESFGPVSVGVDILLAEPDRGPVDEMRRVLEALPSKARVGRLGQLYETLRAIREEDSDAVRRRLEETGHSADWLFAAEGHDAFLEQVIREQGNIVLGTILEYDQVQGQELDWLTPEKNSTPPPQIFEALKLALPEIKDEQICEEWRSGLISLRLLRAAKGLSTVPVAGMGGVSLKELGVGNSSALQILQDVDIPEQGGSRVRGLYLPRGNFLLAAKGTGYMNDDTASDGTVRSFPLVRTLGNKPLPSLGFETLAVGLRSHPELWLSSYGVPEEIRLTDERGPVLRFPVDSYTTVWLNVYPAAPEIEDGVASYPSVTVISAAEVLDAYRSQDPEKKAHMKTTLGKKILFLGVTALGLSDVRLSPLGMMRPGVENHATLVANLLNGEQLQYQEREIFFTVFLTTLLLLTLARILPRIPPDRAILVGVGLALGSFLVCLLAIRFGSILFPLDLLTPLLVYFVIGILFLNRFENRDKAWIDQMFKRYVSPQYVEQIKRNKGELDLHGREARITALFSDLAGFSTISEQFAAERLFAFLGEYLGEMANILDAQGGTLDKFEGDAVVAFFGAPIPFEDHPLRACLTAVEMVRRLEELNVEWQEGGRYPELLRLAADRGYWKPVQVRVGLNSGLCAIGHLGTAERGNYTMMGDNVNLAARLEGVCKLYNVPICISEDTYLEIKEKIACRELDLIRVVGKTIPTRIYQVLGAWSSLSVSQKGFVDASNEAMEAFKRRDFEGALKLFQEAKAIETWDWTTQLYLDRCQNYMVEPPAEDWDGVTDMESK